MSLQRGGERGHALTAACYQGNVKMAILLLNHGADVNAKGGPYTTALQAASSKGHEAVVKLLLARGADPNATGGICGHALGAATEVGSIAVVTALLNGGATIHLNKFYWNGKLFERAARAFQAALYNGHEVVANLLIQRGAEDIGSPQRYARNRPGDGFRLALLKDHEGIVEALLEKMDFTKPAVQRLLKEGVDPNEVSPFNQQRLALGAAASCGSIPVCKLLLTAGADINGHSGASANALHQAVSQG